MRFRIPAGRALGENVPYQMNIGAVSVDELQNGPAKGLYLPGVFLGEYPETSVCIPVYAGDKIKIMHEKIVAIPWFLL